MISVVCGQRANLTVLSCQTILHAPSTKNTTTLPPPLSHLLGLLKFQQASRPLNRNIEVIGLETRQHLQSLQPRRVVAENTCDACGLAVIPQFSRITRARQLVEHKCFLVLAAVLVDQRQEGVWFRDLSRVAHDIVVSDYLHSSARR